MPKALLILSLLLITVGSPSGSPKEGASPVMRPDRSCLLCHAVTSPRADQASRLPRIEPDYVGVTIPPNIAPMNFIVREAGSSFDVTATSGSGQYRLDVRSSDGLVQFPEDSWRELLRESVGDSIVIRITSSGGEGDVEAYSPFSMRVAREEIDSWLVYRLLPPGYYSWSRIKIVQRSLESFREESILDNQILENNCANCHSFNNNSPDRFLIHVRGSLGGTYIVEDGEMTRADPKIDEMPGGATYPAWHPGGRFVAFSSNQVRQSFYSQPGKVVEVYDLVSSLILYDREANQTLSIPSGTVEGDTTAYLETFPSWSPDGDYLYSARAPNLINEADPQLEQIQNTHYDIVRRAFDGEDRSFGAPEVVFDASAMGKSASFPRISPDGRFLVLTLADYGTFPIWHREADLVLLDLGTGEHRPMDVNSDEAESYHTWSSEGRWLVFSSRRLDGRSTRPYFAHVDSLGNQGKEFLLPQEDPSLYDEMIEAFNRPVLANGRVEVDPRDFLKATKQETLRASSGNPPDTILTP
jgi:hypothetical protein